MDEEIMNFQWFEHVTWDCMKDFRGATNVQPPTRFKFALQQAQHAIFRVIIHNNPTSLDARPGKLRECEHLCREQARTQAGSASCAAIFMVFGVLQP